MEREGDSPMHVAGAASNENSVNQKHSGPQIGEKACANTHEASEIRSATKLKRWFKSVRVS